MKKLQSDIKKANTKIINKVRNKGAYENWGQTEHRKLEAKHINSCDYSSDMNEKRDVLTSWIMNIDETIMRGL